MSNKNGVRCVRVAGESIRLTVELYIPGVRVVDIKTPSHERCYLLDTKYSRGTELYENQISCSGYSHAALFPDHATPPANFQNLYELISFNAPRLTLIDCVQIADEYKLFPFTNTDVLLWLATQEFKHAQR